MRDFLTGLAIILIVILTTALVAPYFVDWNGQRSFLEARLTRALGQKVTIGGAIDLKILPTPYLVLDLVVVGADDGQFKLGIHHLNLELAIGPLFQGEFDIVDARLDEPTVRLTLQPDRSLPLLPNAPAFQADVRFDTIQVSDGTLAIADPQSGRTALLEHIDFVAAAGSFAGPFKLNGEVGPDGERTRFTLATQAPSNQAPSNQGPSNNETRLHLDIDRTETHPSLTLDGALDLGPPGALKVEPHFAGTMQTAGQIEQPSAAPISWTLQAPIVMDPREATFGKGELSLGGEESRLTLQATGHLALDPTSEATLSLSAKELDFDRLAPRPAEGETPQPPPFPDPARLAQMLAALALPVPTAVQVKIDSATYGGETLTALSGTTRLGQAGVAPLTLALSGPGGLHVAYDGTIESPPQLALDGAVSAGADDWPRAASWLQHVAPWLSASFPLPSEGLTLHAFDLRTRLKTSPDGVSLTAATLDLDGTNLHGDLALDRAAASRPAKLTAHLQATALDIGSLPSLTGLRTPTQNLDLDLSLTAARLRVGDVGGAPLTAGALHLAVTKAGSQIALRELSIQDFGGTHLDATGELGARDGRLALTLEAAHLEAAAALVKQIAPGVFAQALETRAAVLAPARLSLESQFAADAQGQLATTRFTAHGRLGDTILDASAAPDTIDADSLVLHTRLAAPDGGTLLAQLGFPALPMAVVGPGTLALSARGHRGAPLDTDLTAQTGTTRLALQGRFNLLSTAPSGAGTFNLSSEDVTPLLQTLAIAFPDLTGRLQTELHGTLKADAHHVELDDLAGQFAGLAATGHLAYAPGATPASLTGQLAFEHLRLSDLLGLGLGPPQPASAALAWSRAPLGVGLISPPTSTIALSAQSFDLQPGLVAQNAHFDLALRPDTIAVTQASADLGGGRLSGHVTIHRDGSQASVDGSLTTDKVRLHTATFGGVLQGKLDLAGSGGSAFALVTSLAGTGDLTIDDLVIPQADPGALGKIVADIESDTLSVDETAVKRALADEMQAPLHAGSRHFALSLAAGVIHAAPPSGETSPDPAITDIAADFDLPHETIRLDLTETLTSLPPNWTGPAPSLMLSLAGPLDAPSRTYDVSGFMDTLAQRALARETARIEAYELDIRERAFFNTRLRSEADREAEHQRALEDARRAAEAERKAKAEAARQERLKREQAARAREDAERLAKQKELAKEKPRATLPNSGSGEPRRPPKPDETRSAPGPAPEAPAPPTAADPADPSTLGRY